MIWESRYDIGFGVSISRSLHKIRAATTCAPYRDVNIRICFCLRRRLWRNPLTKPREGGCMTRGFAAGFPVSV